MVAEALREFPPNVAPTLSSLEPGSVPAVNRPSCDTTPPVACHRNAIPFISLPYLSKPAASNLWLVVLSTTANEGCNSILVRELAWMVTFTVADSLCFPLTTSTLIPLGKLPDIVPLENTPSELISPISVATLHADNASEISFPNLSKI